MSQPRKGRSAEVAKKMESIETATGNAIFIEKSSTRGRAGQGRGRAAQRVEEEAGRSSSVSAARRPGRSTSRSRSGRAPRRSSSLSEQHKRKGLSLAKMAGPPSRQADTMPAAYAPRPLDDSMKDESLEKMSTSSRRTQHMKEIAANSSFSSWKASHTSFAPALKTAESNDSSDQGSSVFDLDAPIALASVNSSYRNATNVPPDSSVGSAGYSGDKRRPSFLGLGDSIRSIFVRRGEKDLRTVDQSVNLMDPETGNYGNKLSGGSGAIAAASPSGHAGDRRKRTSFIEVVFGAGDKQRIRQISMKEINLGPDPTNRRQTNMLLLQQAKEQDNPWSKFMSCLKQTFRPVFGIVCSAPFIAAILIIVTLVFWIPYIQEKVNSMPASNPNMPASAPAMIPVLAPVATPAPIPQTEIPTWTQAPVPAISFDRTFAGDSGETKEKPTIAPSQVTNQYSNFAEIKKPTKEENREYSNFAEIQKPTPGGDRLFSNFAEIYTDPQTGANSFTTAVTQLYNEMQDLFVLRQLTSIEDLATMSTPQHLALIWLVTVEPPNDLSNGMDGTKLEETKIIEKYAVAVLFYATTLRNPLMPLGLNSTGLSPEEVELLSYAVPGNFTPNEELHLMYKQMKEQGFNGTLEEFIEMFHYQMSQMEGYNMTPQEELLFLLEGNWGGSNGPTPPAPPPIPKPKTFNLVAPGGRSRLLEGGDAMQFWMSEEDVCKWQGIGCDADGQVTKIDLSKRGLEGEIPSEIHAFEKLVELNLSRNHLHGSLPSEIGTCQFLKHLFLQRNKLRGELPTSLGKLNMLVDLVLTYNKLSGSVPSELARLSDLRAMALNHNKFSGHTPSLQNMNQLEILRLDNNWLEGPIPIGLDDLKKLTKVYLMDNKFTGMVTSFNNSIESLEVVSVDHNNLSGNISKLLCSAVTHHQLKYLAADCKSKVVCSCCHECY